MHYARLSKVSIDDVRIAMFENIDLRKQPRVMLGGAMVKVFGTSCRMKTFYHHGTKCSACDLEARFYAVERDIKCKDGAPYHLNLWGIDTNGDEVLFTHDHTLARSAGGADNISNTTTMCSPCNFAKSLVEKRGK